MFLSFPSTIFLHLLNEAKINEIIIILLKKVLELKTYLS